MRLTLVPHSATPPSHPFGVWANVDFVAGLGATATLNIWFGIETPVSRLAIAEGEPVRTDELWRTTCLEAFLQPVGEIAYREWNFAPSGQWAAYDFTGYREGVAEAPVDQPPYIRMEDNLTWWALGATIAVPGGRHWQLGLSAVIEERDGTKSYWALAHPAEKPDFHAPGCFAGRLP